jgi:hypothetical protein
MVIWSGIDWAKTWAEKFEPIIASLLAISLSNPFASPSLSQNLDLHFVHVTASESSMKPRSQDATSFAKPLIVKGYGYRWTGVARWAIFFGASERVKTQALDLC